ncbi:hypothetical protein PMAYCL1PPCAC_30004, partial [Pristionchus mayeri]
RCIRLNCSRNTSECWEVNKGDAVVVYGRGPFGGMLFAARAWWLLKVYSIHEVAVLEGGIDKWKEEGGATVQG